MLRLIKYWFLLICLSLTAISHSPFLLELTSSFFVDYSYSFGDLYRMSNLPEYKIKRPGCGNRFQNNGKEGGTNLYLLGDSFFANLYKASDRFTDIDNLYFFSWPNKIKIPKLEQRSNNVLVIETIERYALDKSNRMQIVIDDKVDKFTLMVDEDQPKKNEDFIRFESNMYLEQMLFFDPISMCFKDIKASINKVLFERMSKEVRISDDHKYLLFYEETDASNSSFATIDENGFKNAVSNYNSLYEGYKKLGFDQVYLVIVPNKVSIVSPNYHDRSYNHLIEKIRDCPDLKIPFMDLYSVYKNEKTDVYFCNDSHWNCNGMQIFINTLDRKVLRINSNHNPE
jgi:hypothetical protein